MTKISHLLKVMCIKTTIITNPFNVNFLLHCIVFYMVFDDECVASNLFMMSSTYRYICVKEEFDCVLFSTHFKI